MSSAAGRRGVGDELKFGGPGGEEVAGFATEFGGVGADDDALGLGDEDFLEEGDFGFAGPDAGAGKAFGAEEEEVEFPELGGAAGARAEEDGLALEEAAAEEVDFGPGAPEHFGDGEVVGDGAQAGDGLAVEGFGEGEDSGAAVEEAGGAGLDEAAGFLGNAGFDGVIDGAAIGEGGGGGVEAGEGSAVGAGDFFLADEDAEVAAGGGLGDAEAGADFGEGQVVVVFEQFGEGFSPGEDDGGRHFHKAIMLFI